MSDESRWPPGRLAIYLHDLSGGGAERAMVNLGNGLSARGFKVDLVLAVCTGPYLDEVSKKVTIVDLHADRFAFQKNRNSKFSGLESLVVSLIGLFLLARYLRRIGPVSMLAALPGANVTAVIAKVISRVQTRVVISERNVLSPAIRNRKSLLYRSLRLVMPLAYRHADGIIAVSAGVAVDLSKTMKLSKSSIDVVRNPVVSSSLLARSREENHHSLLQKGEPPVVLGVGRLVSQKQFTDLISAFALLCETLDSRLIILGEGPLRSNLERQVRRLGLEAKVSLPGFVDNPYSFMSRAALFVLSSEYEGLPNALIQAMACGAPIVSTDCPSGPSEILEDGKWGRLVPVGDIRGLANAMAETLNERMHPDVSSRAADFSVDKGVDGYLEVMLRNSLPNE